jgi:hypothetical protein
MPRLDGVNTAEVWQPSAPYCQRCGMPMSTPGFWWCWGEGWVCHECQEPKDWIPRPEPEAQEETADQETQSAVENPNREPTGQDAPIIPSASI